MLMCYTFNPDSVFKSVLPNGSEPTWQTSMLYSDIVPLIYVNKTICMVICLLHNSCQSFYGSGQLTWCQGHLKMRVVGKGPGAILWVLRHFSSLISRLLVIWHLAKDYQGAILYAPFWYLSEAFSISFIL